MIAENPTANISKSPLFDIISPDGFVNCLKKMNRSIKPTNHTSPQLDNVEEYKYMVRKQADNERVIILITVDYSYLDMALNLHETSFLKFNITNYVFVCSHQEARQALALRNISAVTLWNDYSGLEASRYQSPTFRQKARYKTTAALIALEMGYTVLLMDADIVFLRDPIPLIKCNSCDIIFQRESNFFKWNTGFYMAFPTEASLQLHRFAIESYRLSPEFSDQPCLNGIISTMEKQGNLKVDILNETLFPNGERYFDQGHRQFAGDHPCPQCAIIHNNDIVSYSNKVYRFKEHLLWMVDHNGYYSNKTAKYLTFNNPPISKLRNVTRKMQHEALENAFMIGEMLDRIVILPKFYCGTCISEPCLDSLQESRCSALAFYDMSILDKAFPGKYREHVFLKHPKVPPKIKNSISEPLLIHTKFLNRSHFKPNKNRTDVTHTFESKHFPQPTTRAQLKEWLTRFTDFHVLKFHSLYGRIMQ